MSKTEINISPTILTPEQVQFFAVNGYIHLPGFYGPDEVSRMRDEFHDMVSNTEGRPGNVGYSFSDPVPGYDVDPFNPRNCSGMMDQVLINDYWFDHFADPRIVAVMVDLLGPNIDFHNGKVRNKPPGFHCDQSWHQDFPYERHTEPNLAAALTYLDATDFEAGATEIVPGSHLQGEWETFDGTRVADSLVADGSWDVCAAEPGDVVVIHVLVVHRAGHNYTNTSRNAIINEYKTAETVDLWNNHCALAGMPLARDSRPLLSPISH
jgi:hypothetical protein